MHVFFRDASELVSLLNRIDGAQYPRYKDSIGVWQFGSAGSNLVPFQLFINKVQSVSMHAYTCAGATV